MHSIVFMIGCALIWASQDIQVPQDKTRYKSSKYWTRFALTILGIMIISQSVKMLV